MTATWEAYGARGRAEKAVRLARKAIACPYPDLAAEWAKLAAGYARNALNLDRAAALSHCGEST